MPIDRSIARFAVAIALCSLAPAALAAPKRLKPTAAATIDVPATLAVLIGADASAAEGAASRLGEVADAAAHGALLDALATGLPPRVAAAALAAVARHPAPGDAAVVRLYAVHRNPLPRAAAFAALAQPPGTGLDAEGQRLVLAALGDEEPSVRTAAAAAAARARLAAAAPRLLALLGKGDAGAGPALADLADADLARRIADLLGTAPDALLSQCLGRLLLRRDFGPEAARVQVVRVLAKVPGPEAITALTEYLEAIASGPARLSRREAEAALETRRGGS
jgi:hypothetical protein